jgi:hypothetical protein
MQPPVASRPALRVNLDPLQRPSSVSICCLDPDLVVFLANCARPDDLLKSLFRVTVTEVPSPEGEGLPDVSGHYLLFEDEVEFIPHFPFEKDVKYRASFNPHRLSASPASDLLNLEFLIPAEQHAPALTEVTHIFPSLDLLPENLLRFYVCFSNSMQRGRTLKEISLLDSDGNSVDDALYRAPVELWDRGMRYLTVLLDPGRLKRWVGPNVELGPPLKAGQEYILEIGSGMTDLHGRPLAGRFRKHFVAGDPVRECVSVDDWEILPPGTGSRQSLVLIFPRPLDWALLLQMITIESEDGFVINGQVAVDQCERRWSFIPASPWTAGMYHIRVGSNLEDVCGNSITGPFDRPLRNHPRTDLASSSLTFQLT